MREIKRAIKAIILARVSTEEQAGDGHFSLPAQLKNLREYVKRKNLEVIAEHCFDESASKDKRRKFEDAISVVETATEPIAIVVDKVDRLQRNYNETVRFDKLRRDGKVELHFVNDGGLVIHRNSPAGDLGHWNNLVNFAFMYTAQLSENVKRGIKGKLDKGLYPGGEVPAGYKWIKKEVEGRFLSVVEVDEERAPFVKKCFNFYFTGKHTVESLAKEMGKLGFTTKTKKVRVNGRLKERGLKLVSSVDVNSILKNPFYYGKFSYLNPETGERELWDNKGTYKPLITKQLFDGVQEVLKNHNSRVNGYTKNNFKFAKLLSCGFCGHTLTAEEMSRTYKDKDKDSPDVPIYYHCNNGKTHNDPDWYRKEFGTEHSGVHIYKGRKEEKKGQTIYACPQKWWKESEIEHWILSELDHVDYGEEVFALFRDMLEEEYDGRVELASEQIKLAKADRTRNQALIKGLVHNMALEKESELREDFRAEYNKIKERQKELDEEIDTFEGSIEADTDEAVQTLRYCSNLREQYESLDDSKKREMLSVVFSKVEALKGEYRLNKGKGRMFKPDQINFLWNEPFATLKSINLPELAEQWERTKGKNIRLTKNNQTEASPFP